MKPKTMGSPNHIDPAGKPVWMPARDLQQNKLQSGRPTKTDDLYDGRFENIKGHKIKKGK